MMVTMRSSSSEVISPALRDGRIRNFVFRLAGQRYAPFVQVNIGLFAHQIRISPSDTFYLG